MEGEKQLTAAMLSIGMAVIIAALVSISGMNVVLGESSNADNATDEATVYVTIGNITMIDVTPEIMHFGTAYPGQTVTQYNVTEENVLLTAFQIENLGSTNITKVWLNVTQPTARHFGTGDPSKYDPGNWIAVDYNYTLNGVTAPTIDMSYIDRVEWNSTYPLVYLQTPQNTVSYGRFRIANHEYFWAITDSGTGDCSSAGTVTFYLSNYNEPHNLTDTGDIDLTDGDETTINFGGSGTYSGTTWLYPSAALQLGTTDEKYLVFVKQGCDQVRFVAWNRDFAEQVGADLSLLPNNASVFDSAIAGREMAPGENIAMNVELRIPYGVPQYADYSGTMTVIATRL